MYNDLPEIKEEDLPILDRILKILATERPVLPDGDILKMGASEEDLLRYKKILTDVRVRAAEPEQYNRYLARIWPDATLRFYELNKINDLYLSQQQEIQERHRELAIQDDTLKTSKKNTAINLHICVWTAIAAVIALFTFLCSRLP